MLCRTETMTAAIGTTGINVNSEIMAMIGMEIGETGMDIDKRFSL